MSTRAAVISGLVTGALVLLVVWVFEVPLDRAAVLAPVLVVVFGFVAGLFVLWARVGWEQLRAARHPHRIVGIAVAVVGVLVLLTLLGVQLPRE